MIKSLQQLSKQANIKQDRLTPIVLDISRVLDKQITKIIHKKNLKVNHLQRATIRDYLLGYPISTLTVKLSKIRITKQDTNRAIKLLNSGYKKHPKQLIENIKARYQEHYIEKNYLQKRINRYVKYIHKLQENKYQLMYINVTNQSANQINYFIKNYYNQLSNYHNCVITFNNPNFTTIAKVAIYMQNFLKEYAFHPFRFNRKNRIKSLNKFLHKNGYIANYGLSQYIDKFYNGISYGFRFIDLFISKNCQKITLIMQKVQLDKTPVRCPICFHYSNKGNSYPHILFKSFECNNPACPATSKSGRGKRYTLLSAKQQIMVDRNKMTDRINSQLWKAFHLDIVKKQYLNLYSAIKLYTWSGDKVLAINTNHFDSNYYGRKINEIYSIMKSPKINLFKTLSIVKLLEQISNKISLEGENGLNKIKLKSIGNQILINTNSNNLYQLTKKHHFQISSAITSPPYYNARPYSQWNSFLCYLIDMMVNAKSVYKSMKEHGIYIYNVGDIVGQDKVFIKSRMSINRLMLGFYSILIMKIVGFNFCGDIIWDKGQVQSHRNANANHFPMYLKPDNCYEHNLILCKGKYNKSPKLIKNRVVSIPPVKKINSNGKNTLGHSAPFPIKLAKLILPFSTKGSYILDSFVGSGTTCVMAKKYGYKSIGIELSPKYYQLCIKRLRD